MLRVCLRVCLLALSGSIALGAQAPPSSPAAAIRSVAAYDFTLVVREDGSVVGWGRDTDGQSLKPAARMLTAPIALDLPAKVAQVAMGQSTQYALLESGAVVAWGTNDEGQLGNGPMGKNCEGYPKPSTTPVRVTGLSDVIEIGAGWKFAVALKKDGTVWAWGTRDDARLGDGKPTGIRPVCVTGPVRVPGLSGITQIAVGWQHTLALRADGKIMAWGYNRYGELGNDSREPGWNATEVKGLDRVVSIAADSGISGAVRADGTVWMWGTNVSAQMGNGQGPMSADDPGGRTLLPAQVKGVAGASSVSIGNGHAGVLLGDGTVRLWGFNAWGQIGVGASGGYQPKPVKPAITGVARLYLDGPYSYAVKTDGTLWKWGRGYSENGRGPFGLNLKVPTKLDLP